MTLDPLEMYKRKKTDIESKACAKFCTFHLQKFGKKAIECVIQGFFPK